MKRVNEVDNLRGISIIGVLLIHISAYFIGDSQETTNLLAIIVNQVSRFAVPTFFIISGWGLTYNNKLKEGYYIFLAKQILKIISLYFLWSFFYYLYFNSGNFNIYDFILGFVIGTNSYHLYYVPVLIFFYLIYPIVLRVVNKRFGIFIFFLISLFSQLIVYFNLIPEFGSDQNVFNWIFFFALGVWSSLNRFKVNKFIYTRKLQIFLFMITLIFVILETLNIGKIASMRPSVIFYSLTTVIMIVKFTKESKLLYILSKYSYGIYLSHPIFLFVFESNLENINSNIYLGLYMLIALLVVLTLSLITSVVLTRFDRVLSVSLVNTLNSLW